MNERDLKSSGWLTCSIGGTSFMEARIRQFNCLNFWWIRLSRWGEEVVPSGLSPPGQRSLFNSTLPQEATSHWSISLSGFIWREPIRKDYKGALNKMLFPMKKGSLFVGLFASCSPALSASWKIDANLLKMGHMSLKKHRGKCWNSFK